MGGGVSMYDGESFTHFGEKEGFGNHAVNSIMEDSYGNIWFGTRGGGVNIYYPRILENLTEKEGLIDYGVGSIMEDHHGNLWFVSGGVGVSVYNGEFFKHFTAEEGIGTNFITSILEDSRGNIWFGSDIGGFVRYDGKSFARFTDHGVFEQTTVKSMMEDSLGRLWLGTLGMGLICFDGVTFTHFSEKEGFTNTNVESVLEDSQGNLWFSILGGGVTRYNGLDFTTFSRREGLSDNSVLCMLEDRHGKLWFGTEGGGVNLFDGDSITYFTEKEGLSDNSVQSIVEDNNGNIWLGTLKGLSCLVFGSQSAPGKGNRKRPAIHTFNQQDGLKGMDFMMSSAELDSRNRLWWGTGKCLTMMDMNSFHLAADPPTHLQLNRIEINGQFADFHHLEDHTGIKMEFDSVSRFNNYPLNLKLPHKNNHLTFYFSAIDWSAPHKIKYSYKMEGLRSNWSNPGEEAKADYRNLPWGTFHFKIRAIGEAQVWSEPFEYIFTVRPPWWFSWWTFSIYGFILIGIILLYRRFLLRRAKLQSDIEIERIEKEKLLELDHMKSRFFANISHEFRTPLTLIIGPVNDLLNRWDNLKPGDRSLLGTMKRNALRLQQLINQLLDLSRLETGKLKLEVSEGDLTGFIRSIVLSFLSLAESKKINYSHELKDSSFPVFFDRDKIVKIVTNLVSNALKFTPEGGSVRIALQYVLDEVLKPGTHAILLVRDTGPGIPTEHQEKIFDRFYQVQTSDSRTHEGSGIGLALVKELVELYGGEIHVESIPGSGSTFTVKLPVSREHFRETEIFTSPEKQTERGLPLDIDSPGNKVEGPGVQQDRINKDKKGNPVILIVEDNPDLRDYIMQNLLGDYRILQAENGNAGLRKTIECIPDLVITDLMMPEMDGMEMCHRLKTDYRTNHIPLIMLTAKADRESKLESFQTGADDFILKPFDAEELKARVKNLIDQRIQLRERYRQELMSDGGGGEIPHPEDEFMVRVMNCMKKHLSESEFNVEQMGKELSLSRTQLYRKILTITDHTPGELIRSNRLKMAARMFREGHRNVTSVMYSVGFDTSVNFAHHFRQMFGVNPSEYIKQNTPSK